MKQEVGVHWRKWWEYGVKLKPDGLFEEVEIDLKGQMKVFLEVTLLPSQKQLWLV